ncbi:PREDICTED: FAR1-RELATED SEQUENCE [Prunus dulcis]|uniref:Protein FAR1-RELATED SEQUENCE n=1 Tax=Prunus dulcis TaxID=3755 RepID=A0A5E4G1V6_PRUDU|nr:PREDICTED: FAR1-RELATED SEQUENCE [Prunus dulcis]
MNAFFDGFVNSKTTLKQFVEQYENALLDKVEKENHNIWMLIWLFEFRGVLCRHIIVVLIEKKIFRILDEYILRRWRKDVKRSHSKVRISSEDWTAKSEAQRFDKMWQT